MNPTDNSPAQSMADRLFPNTARPVAAAPVEPATPAVSAPTAAPAAPAAPTTPSAPAENGRAPDGSFRQSHGDTAETLADRLYRDPPEPQDDELPAEIRDLRNTAERRMFKAESTYGSGLKGLFEGDANARDSTHRWAEVMADHEASAEEAGLMVTLVKQARAELPSDDAVNAWAEQSIAQTRRAYGAKADAVLADARKLVARDSRVQQLLLHSGLGSHPAVVKMFIQKAQSLRAAGRF